MHDHKATTSQSEISLSHKSLRTAKGSTKMKWVHDSLRLTRWHCIIPPNLDSTPPYSQVRSIRLQPLNSPAHPQISAIHLLQPYLHQPNTTNNPISRADLLVPKQATDLLGFPRTHANTFVFSRTRSTVSPARTISTSLSDHTVHSLCSHRLLSSRGL